MNNTEAEPLAHDDGVFLSRGEVARIFGVSLSTVTRWARTGMVPAVRTPGGHYRFRADDFRGDSRERLPVPPAAAGAASDT